MASDSRQTVTLKNQAETVNSDFAYKTFLLPGPQVGRAPSVRRRWRRQCPEPGGSALPRRWWKKAMTWRWWPRSSSATFTTLPEVDTGFYVAGFKREGRASIPHVYYCHVARAEVSRKNVNVQNGELTYGASWGGQADVMTRLLKPKQVVGRAEGQLQEISDARVTRRLPKCRTPSTSPSTPCATTIDTMRFEVRPKNVGGSIDVRRADAGRSALVFNARSYTASRPPPSAVTSERKDEMGCPPRSAQAISAGRRCVLCRRRGGGQDGGGTATPRRRAAPSSVVAEQNLGLWQASELRSAMYDLLAVSRRRTSAAGSSAATR